MAHATSRFGHYDITTLVDGVFEAPTDVLIHAGGDAARRQLIEAWGGKGIRIDVNVFALRSQDGVTLIDAGVGPAWGAQFGKLREALPAAGILPEQIERVLLTHIHGDHALGLLDGPAPWLPRAELLVPAADLAYFTDPAARAASPEARRGGFDIAASLVTVYAGRLRTIAPGPVRGMPGVEGIALPGHTPGQMGFLLRGAEESLMIWADALHLPDAQAADPDIGLAFDVDPAQAVRTRRALLERAAQEGWIVAGSHVTGLGQVQRAGNAFRFAPAGDGA